MRERLGFVTGAFMSSPHAYYLVKGMKSEYNFLPYPVFQQAGQYLWNATTPLHQERVSAIAWTSTTTDDGVELDERPADGPDASLSAAQSSADAEYTLEGRQMNSSSGFT